MKGKLSSMWRVVIALALVAGLSLVAAAPVAALGQPTVTFVTTADSEISKANADYIIIFTLGEELYGASDTITITFPDDTTVAEGAISNASIQASPGWFSAAAIAAVTNITTAWDDAEVGGITFSGNATARTVTASLAAQDAIGQAATVRIELTEGITNPSAVGDYTLTVKTSDETTAVTSASYSITAPLLGGTVEVFNPSGVKMATFSGTNALDQDQAGAYYDKKNYTIEVGPGTYKITDGQEMVINADGVTLKSTDGAASTIIDGSLLTGSMPILRIIGGADVTVEGFTFDKSPFDGIWISGQRAIVQNNIITDAAWFGITLTDGGTAKATVSGNIITDCPGGIDVIGDGSQDNTVSGNVITGCDALNPRDSDQPHAAIRLSGGTDSTSTDGNTITGNTLTDNDGCAIGLCNGDFYKGGVYFDNNLIKGNTISGNSLEGIKIAASLTNLTNLVITGNDITDNTGVGIIVDSWTAASDAIKFNNITGNDTTNGYGLQNSSGVAVDATHNWWGSAVATEVAAMVKDATTSDVTTYTPFLTGTVDTVFSATAVDTGSVASLDAETDVGVEVLVSSGTGTDAEVVSAAKYIANPGGPLDNALAFYDVYVTGAFAAATDTVMLHFYAGDDDALLYAWSSNTDTWVAVSPAAVFSEFGGYLHVTLNTSGATTPSTPNIADLTGTPFAVCGVAEVIPGDANGDGVVNALDITKTERIIAGLD